MAKLSEQSLEEIRRNAEELTKRVRQGRIDMEKARPLLQKARTEIDTREQALQTRRETPQIGVPDTPEQRFVRGKLPPSGKLESRLSDEISALVTGRETREMDLPPGFGDRALRVFEQVGLGEPARKVLMELAQSAPLGSDITPEQMDRLTDVPSDAIDEIQRAGTFLKVLVPSAINIVDQAIAGGARFAAPKATQALPRVPLEFRREIEESADEERTAAAEQAISEIGVGIFFPSAIFSALSRARWVDDIARNTRSLRTVPIKEGVRQPRPFAVAQEKESIEVAAKTVAEGFAKVRQRAKLRDPRRTLSSERSAQSVEQSTAKSLRRRQQNAEKAGDQAAAQELGAEAARIEAAAESRVPSIERLEAAVAQRTTREAGAPIRAGEEPGLVPGVVRLGPRRVAAPLPEVQGWTGGLRVVDDVELPAPFQGRAQAIFRRGIRAEGRQGGPSYDPVGRGSYIGIEEIKAAVPDEAGEITGGLYRVEVGRNDGTDIIRSQPMTLQNAQALQGRLHEVYAELVPLSRTLTRDDVPRAFVQGVERAVARSVSTRPRHVQAYIDALESVTGKPVNQISRQELNRLAQLPLHKEEEIARLIKIRQGHERAVQEGLDRVAATKIADNEEAYLRWIANDPPPPGGPGAPGGGGSGRVGASPDVLGATDERMMGWLERVVRMEMEPGLARRIGPEGDALITAKLMAERDAALGLGRLWDGVEDVLRDIRWRRSWSENLADVLEGKAKAANPRIARAARIIKSWNEFTLRSAQEAGVLTRGANGELRLVQGIEDFFPRQIRRKFLRTARRRRQLARALAAENGITFDEAKKVVFNWRGLQRRGKSGSLNFERQWKIPPEFLERDAHRVLPRYWAQAWTEIGEARHLGPQAENVIALQKSVIDRGGDAELFKRLARRMIGAEEFTPEGAKASRFVRGTAVVTTMHRSQLSSLASLANIPNIARGRGFHGMVLDGVPTIVDVARDVLNIAPRNIRRLGRLGGTIENDILRLAQDVGDFDVARGFLRIVGQRRVELGIRRGMMGLGRRHATRLTKHLHRRRALGMSDNPYAKQILIEHLNDVDDVERAALEADEVIRLGKLSPDQINRIGFNVTRRSQPMSQTDLPFYAQSNLGRARHQFRITLLKEMRLVASTAGRDAATWFRTLGREGSLKPLTAYLLFGAMMGEAITDGKLVISAAMQLQDPEIVLGRRTENLIFRFLDNMLQIGGFGLVMDFLASVHWDKKTGALSVIMGPGAGKLSEIIGNVFNLDGQRTLESLGPVRFEQNPNLGRSPTQRVFEGLTR